MDREINLHRDAEELLTSLLSWWSEKVLLPDGFYGRVCDEGTPIREAPRGLILGARLLWTYASAYRITGNAEYRASAEGLYAYLKAAFRDEKYGGAYFEVAPDGKPTKDYKHIYAEAFVLYALAAYYEATGDKRALDDADGIFACIEKAHDEKYGGYFEVLHRDGSPAPEIPGTNLTLSQEKTMNTSLHVMEALSAYLRVKEDGLVRKRLEEMFDIFLRRILDPTTGHFFMFFDRAWTPDGLARSYGHDIEGSWLMTEAAEVLGNPDAIEKARRNAIFMTDAVLGEGMTDCGALVTEYDPTTGKRTELFSWWEQNETVVGTYNAYQITKDEKYLRQAEKTLHMILSHHIDREKGGYYPYLLANLTPRHGDKANMWICPYHNGRMAMELIKRTEKEV